MHTHHVSGVRHLIIRYGKDGRLQRRFAYGHGFRSYLRADPEAKKIDFAPHREFYSDADAQAVVDMVNSRAKSIG